MEKQKVATNSAPAAIGPYSQAIQTGNMVFVSGQLPIIPETGALSEGTMTEQTQQSLKNIGEILKAAGGSLDNVVKTTIFMADLGDFAEVNAAYAQFFTGAAPARSCVQAAALPKNGRIEIEAIAVL